MSFIRTANNSPLVAKHLLRRNSITESITLTSEELLFLIASPTTVDNYLLSLLALTRNLTLTLTPGLEQIGFLVDDVSLKYNSNIKTWSLDVPGVRKQYQTLSELLFSSQSLFPFKPLRFHPILDILRVETCSDFYFEWYLKIPENDLEVSLDVDVIRFVSLYLPSIISAENKQLIISDQEEILDTISADEVEDLIRV
jgi:hypothetical protein